MKYMRKTPVEAIQWNGDNQREVYDFMNKTARACCNAADSSGNLIMFWKDFARRKFKAVVPMLGWVVRDDKAFKFYKDSSFRKTFEAVADDCKGIDWKSVKAITEAFCGFGAEPSKETLEAIRMRAYIDPNNPLAKMVDDIYSEDEKIREQVKKMLSEGDTHKATFESVLDEMKELHAKKDKDYGSAFHKSFEEFGVTSGVVRLNDKMERVKSLVKNGKAEVQDDSLLDSLKDMACYAVMLYVELKNKKNGTDKD